MKRQNLSKSKKLSKVARIKASSQSMKHYFMRYLAFQNKIVKDVIVDKKD